MSIDQKTIGEIFGQASNASDFFYELGGIVLDEFSYIRIIGQIERAEGPDTYKMLKACLQRVLRPYCHINSIPNDASQKRLRAVLSLYFVWEGVFSYGQAAGHELWPHIFNGLLLPCDANASAQCGRLFLQTLQENDLETFEHVQGGLIYVTKILLHGLIPEIHLNRFIKELVVPEQSNIRGNYLTGNHLIDKIRNSNELECQPKTIQRFIKYGWPVNAQILDKFWDMVKNWDRNGQEQWWRWGLPKYMVDAFSESVNRPQLVAIKKRNKKEGFGGRPHLSFDFESEFPMLIIPPQETCRDSHLEICHCPLDAPQQELSETTKISSVYIDGKYYSDNRNDSVYPSNFWRVQVLGNDFMSVRYDFPVGDDGNAVPFYLFNSETSKLIGNFPENCPKEIIIVYPKQSDFDLDGGTRLTEAIPLYHKWKAWQYVICELEEEESVSFFMRG